LSINGPKTEVISTEKQYIEMPPSYMDDTDMGDGFDGGKRKKLI